MESTTAGKQRTTKLAEVKALIQITAEQLQRVAEERKLELLPHFTDKEECNDYKLKKRTGFEVNIRKNRTVITNWIKHAEWEERLQEVQRARSIYERALDVDYLNMELWLNYAEMEMKIGHVNHARNIWDRATTTLPRVNQFWYKYTQMEEMLGDTAGCRQVFERWMQWNPEEQAWPAYINFELRYKEVDKARSIYERFILQHPKARNWVEFAHFEEHHGYIARSRRVYERAVEFFGGKYRYIDENLFVAFARFEETFKNDTVFEKKFGD